MYFAILLPERNENSFPYKTFILLFLGFFLVKNKLERQHDAFLWHGSKL